MSAYEHLSGFQAKMRRLSEKDNLFVAVDDGNGGGRYTYSDDFVSAYTDAYNGLNSETIGTADSYSPSEVAEARSIVEGIFGYGDDSLGTTTVVNNALTDQQFAGKINQSDLYTSAGTISLRRGLVSSYFGSRDDYSRMSDAEVVARFRVMNQNLENLGKVNNLMFKYLENDPRYNQFVDSMTKSPIHKITRGIVKAVRSIKKTVNKTFHKIVSLFTSPSPMQQILSGKRPVSSAAEIKAAKAMADALKAWKDEMAKANEQTEEQTNNQAEGDVQGNSVNDADNVEETIAEPVETPVPEERTDTSDSVTVDFEWRDPYGGDGFVYETPEPEPETTPPPKPEPEKPKTTTVRKTVSKVKPITVEELAEDPSKFGDYPSMTHIDDSDKKKVPRGYNHEGEIAVGKDEKGRPIIVSVYQKPGSNQLYYGNPRVNDKVKDHKYVRDHLEAGSNFGEIKVGRKKDVGFRYKINEDGSLQFVPSELMAQFENGTATRKVEEYVEEEVVVEVPFDGDVKETQEKGAPVAIYENDSEFNPPEGITPKTVKVKSGDELYGTLKTFEYYEDPNHKGTFLVREVVEAETTATMADRDEWDSAPTRLVLHSDAYDQDFNFDPSEEFGLLKNVDQIVEQEKIDAERRRQDELTAQQEEELRIQREQAEIDSKKDYKHNGPDSNLYDFGDKQYPTFRHAQRQDELHGHTKLSTLIPVGVKEVVMSDGTTQQRVVAVEVWRSNDNPNEYLIGDEVVTSYGPDSFKEELAWTDGVSPVIDINNHKGHNDRQPVPVVIGRDANGKVTIVSAEFVQDYEAGKVKNKFSEKVSGVPEPEPDITSEMSDAYIYGRLHSDELMKFIGKKKNYDMMEEMEAFYASQGSPKQEVDNFRKIANNEAEVSRIIDYNTVAAKEFAKFKKRHKDLSEQEAKIEFMMEYQKEMRQAKERGKLDKFIKKYAKGQKNPPKSPLDTEREIVEEQDPRPMGKDSIIAETVLTEDQQREFDGHLQETSEVVYVDGARSPESGTTGNPGETSTGTGETTVTETTSTGTMDFDYYNQDGGNWTFGENGGVSFTYDTETNPEVITGEVGNGGTTTTPETKPGRDYYDPIDTFGGDTSGTYTPPEFEPIVTETPIVEPVTGGTGTGTNTGTGTGANPGTGTEFEPIVPGEEPPKPPQPQTPVSGGQTELPSGIDNMAADCLWKDILDTVGNEKKADGSPYIGKNVLEILKLAASDGTKQADPAIEKKMIEIILESYKNAHLRELLEAKGLSKLPEGKEGQALIEESKKLAIQDFNSLGWEQFSIRGKARLTLFELSKGKFNPNNGKELEDGQIPDDHRRDSFFYRALCKSGIDFDLRHYREKVKGILETQIAGEDALTRPDNVNFDPNNIDPNKFTEVTVIGEDGKPMKVHKITINGKDVYMTTDHKSILEVSDVTASKTSGKFGEISIEDVNDKVRESRPKTAAGTKGMSWVTQEQRDDARGVGDGRAEMGGR